MAKNRSLNDWDRESFQENPTDSISERRVTDTDTHTILENINKGDGDLAGSTEIFTGTATTTVTNLPTTADKVISEIGVLRASSGAGDLLVSMDNGATFMPLEKIDTLTWEPKGKIKQIQVKTSAGSITFRILINFKDF